MLLYLMSQIWGSTWIRQPVSKADKNLGQNVVIQLKSPLQDSGGNVSMDIYFTGVPLAMLMLQHRLTIVSTIKKYKQKIPECMKVANSRDTKTSVTGFNDQMTMVRYEQTKQLFFWSRCITIQAVMTKTQKRDPKLSGFITRQRLVLT